MLNGVQGECIGLISDALSAQLHEQQSYALFCSALHRSTALCLTCACLQISKLPGLDAQLVREVLHDIQQAERRQADALCTLQAGRATVQVSKACQCQWLLHKGLAELTEVLASCLAQTPSL